MIGYLHKVTPVSGLNIKVTGILSSCLAHNIPVILIAEEEDHPKAKELLAGYQGEVVFTSPEKLAQQVFEILG